MSRSFCPSSRSLPCSSNVDFVGGSLAAVLHATSDFDRVVRKYNRNAYTQLGSTASSKQQRARTVRLSPIRRACSSSPVTCEVGESVVGGDHSVVHSATPAPCAALEHSAVVGEAENTSPQSGPSPPPKVSFADHVSFFLTPVQTAEDPPPLTTSADTSVVSPSQVDENDASPIRTAHDYYSMSDAALSRQCSVVSDIFDGTYFPHNRIRPRKYISTTLPWAKEYTSERRRFESRTDVEMQQEIAAESTFWQAPISDVLPRGNSPVRPGDTIAQRLEDKKRLANTKFLTKVRQYMVSVEALMERETEASRKAAEAAAAERRRMSEWSAAHPFSAGGVLDKTFTSIAKDVAEPKFSSMANRYYNIAYRNRQLDIDLKEGFVVKLEHSTFRLQSIMSYNEFVVVYRQFHRYAAPNGYLTIAQIPKNGWIFVDKVIKTLITRKIDKNKSGKIMLPDLIKHLFPAMTLPEITVAITAYEEQYLAFIDKKVYLFLDTIDVDKVNHFGVVFSIIDKLGNGKVLKDEFVENMPVDREASNDELELIKQFLAELFDSNARRDLNEKLELVGEPYLDLDNMASALSISRYNAYGGKMM